MSLSNYRSEPSCRTLLLLVAAILLLASSVPQVNAQTSYNFAPKNGPSLEITKVKAQGEAKVSVRILLKIEGEPDAILPLDGKYTVTANDVNNDDKENVAKKLAENINAQLKNLGLGPFITTDGNGKLITAGTCGWDVSSQDSIVVTVD